MKKALFLKTLALIIGLMFQTTMSWGQLLVENFDYTIGSLLTANGWTAHSGGGTQPIDVTTGLNFTGYIGSGIGGAANVDNNGEDDNKTFDPQTTGTVYAAFLVNVQATVAGYFLNLGGNPIGTTFRGKVFLDATNHFGVSVGINTPTVAASAYTLGNTYFLVLKYEIVDGTNNDKVSLYIFDGAFPSSEPLTPTIGPLTDVTQSDINPASIALRQFSATQKIIVDGIRIATNWAQAATAGGGTPLVSTPTFTPTPGVTENPVDVSISCSTPNSSIYYTLNGSDPDENSTPFTIPFNISQTTTVKARAYAAGFDPSNIATAVYTFRTAVSTIAELRAGSAGVPYLLTGEAYFTYQQSFRNQKFIQDYTAAILIDDAPNGVGNPGVIISEYEIGDGITGLKGSLLPYNGMLQFVPAFDPGESTGFHLFTPEVITIAQLNSNFEDYEAELVKIENTTFANGAATFVAGTVYPISDVSDATGNFRTSFYDADYLAAPTTIPIVPCTLIGIPNAYSNVNYFTSRWSADIIPTVVTPTILVTSPNGFEFWEQGSTHNITWANISFSGNVKITLVKNAFVSTVLVTDLPNTGSWVWNIPENLAITNTYKIKVEGVVAGDPSDMSNDAFSIVAPQPVPVIVINEIMYNPSNANPFLNDDFYEYLELYNNSGFDVNLDGWYFSQGITHTFATGTTILDGGYLVVAINADSIMDHYSISNVVKWTSGNLNNGGETIELKSFDGTTMDLVAYSDVAPWPTSPDGTGTSLELLDPDFDNALSQSWFASALMLGTPGIQNSVYGVEILTLTAPNGGQIFEQGSSQAITWIHANFNGFIKIELITSADNREILAENVPVTDLLWDWEIPSNQIVGNNYKIKISDQADGNPMDESNAVFSIIAVVPPTLTVISPDGGEQWEQGSTHAITWTSVNFAGNVKIELSDGAKLIAVLNPSIASSVGTWDWAIPSDQAVGSAYTVIISGLVAGEPTDVSNAPFSVNAPATLPALVINEIMYNTPGVDNEWIEIYNNDVITVDLEGYYILDIDNAHVPVTFPAGYSIAPGQYFTVSLELLAPPLPFTPDFTGNAGWSLGNTSDDVRLFHPGGQLVDHVLYFTTAPWPTTANGSGPSLSLLDPNLDNNVGTSWAASLINGGSPGSENFPQAPTLTVTSPNGGEQWIQGSTYPITWISANFDGSIKIELETIAKTLVTLAENIPASDGTWSWAIPADQAVGSNYKIKISDQTIGDPMDESNATFSVIAPPSLPKIVITEIMYNPAEADTDTTEFFEIYNNDIVNVNLLGWTVSLGVVFTFPSYDLAPGAYCVIAFNSVAVMNTFGVSSLQWTSGALSNSGEALEIKNAAGEVIDNVLFDDVAPWPLSPDGFGPSLSLCDPSSDNSVAANWSPCIEYVKNNAAGDAIYATPGAGCSGALAQTMIISIGWAGVSSYMIPTTPAISSMFAPIVNSVVVLQDFSKLYLPSLGINTIGNWDIETGYQIKLTAGKYFVIKGTYETDKTISLTAGWNGIPVISTCPVNVATLFGSIPEIIFAKEMGSDLVYWPLGGLNTLITLVPGKAYFVKTTAAINLTFPECAGKGDVVFDEPVNKISSIWNEVVPTGASHAIGFAASALANLQAGDVIGAFGSNGVCSGITGVGEGNALIMAWADDIYTLEVDGFNAEEQLTYKVYRPSTGEVFEVTAVYDSNSPDAGNFVTNGISFVTGLKMGATGINAITTGNVRIYPNPATSAVNIEMAQQFTSVEVYSMVGSLLFTGNVSGNLLKLDVSNFDRGVYFLKLINQNSGDQVTTRFIKD